MFRGVAEACMWYARNETPQPESWGQGPGLPSSGWCHDKVVSHPGYSFFALQY
jgi:hypothetical protein